MGKKNKKKSFSTQNNPNQKSGRGRGAVQSGRGRGAVAVRGKGHASHSGAARGRGRGKGQIVRARRARAVSSNRGRGRGSLTRLVVNEPAPPTTTAQKKTREQIRQEKLVELKRKLLAAKRATNTSAPPKSAAAKNQSGSNTTDPTLSPGSQHRLELRRRAEQSLMRAKSGSPKPPQQKQHQPQMKVTQPPKKKARLNPNAAVFEINSPSKSINPSNSNIPPAINSPLRPPSQQITSTLNVPYGSVPLSNANISRISVQPQSTSMQQQVRTTTTPLVPPVSIQNLKSYRQHQLNPNSKSFTTTMFDRKDRPIKTVISTHPPISAQQRQANAPSMPSSTSSSTMPSKPKLVNLPLDAPNWQCTICTFHNENNISDVCSMCGQKNTVKRPIPKSNTNNSNIASIPAVPKQPIRKLSQSKPTTKINPNIPTKPEIKVNPPQSTIPSLSIPSKTSVSSSTSDKVSPKKRFKFSPSARRKANLSPNKNPQKLPIATQPTSNKTVGVESNTNSSQLIPISTSKVDDSKVSKLPTTSLPSVPVESASKTASKLKVKQGSKAKHVIGNVNPKVPSLSKQKEIPKPKPKVNRMAKITVEECWKMDMKEKLSEEEIASFIKKTNAYIENANKELRSECRWNGVRYVDPMSMEDDAAMELDIAAEFEWINTLSKEQGVSWRDNFDLNVFGNIVTDITSC